MVESVLSYEEEVFFEINLMFTWSLLLADRAEESWNHHQ
jgi:hypothetical protein